MKNTEEFIVDFRTDAWRTMGARYNSARRLRRRDLVATFSIAIFSAVSIGLALVQKVYAFQPNSAADNYFTALSVLIGLFVLVISLIEWGSNNQVKAEKLHENAECLNDFQRKLGQIIAEVRDGRQLLPIEADALRKEYEDIKKRISFNHEPLDDDLFVAGHRTSPEFVDQAGGPRMQWHCAQWVKIRHVMSGIWIFGIFWVVIILFVWGVHGEL
jgi:hypothetical protein